MEANDNVVVVSPDGRRLATADAQVRQRVEYRSRPTSASASTAGTEHLEGNSFRSDPDFKNVVTDRPRGVAGDGMLLPGQEEQ